MVSRVFISIFIQGVCNEDFGHKLDGLDYSIKFINLRQFNRYSN
jgi:hypothetical protein